MGSPQALDVVLDLLPRRQARRQEEALVRREGTPVEEVLERPAIDGQKLRSGDEPQLAPWNPPPTDCTRITAPAYLQGLL